ncbi:hypothetical protein LTR08_001282 [Meristemomyces frigidus]|nr:hypothetical protein LTR08_001282 [Meristemomyces frigidus]
MATLLRPRLPPTLTLVPHTRAFTTTPPRPVSLQLEKNDPTLVADTLPPYPHGPTRWYKQSALGLYGTTRIRFGNNVGPKIAVKTRRTWLPNILTRKLYSKGLARHVQVRVSTRVLRTIDKVGGLDEYLLGEKEARVKGLGESGWWLRWAIMQTDPIKARFAAERERLGLPPAVAATMTTIALGDVDTPAATAIDEISALDAELDSDPVPMDDAFTILPLTSPTTTTPTTTQTTPPHSPPRKSALRFRVSPHKHLLLTPTGWRRTRPSTPHATATATLAIQTRIAAHLLPAREKAFRAEVALLAPQELGGGGLTADETRGVVREARRVWRREIEGLARGEWEGRVRGREARRVLRRGGGGGGGVELGGGV